MWMFRPYLRVAIGCDVFLMNKLQAPCLLSYKGVELATLSKMKRIQLYLMLSLSICGFSQEVNSRVQQIR
jgi:hypothetical protein